MEAIDQATSDRIEQLRMKTLLYKAESKMNNAQLAEDFDLSKNVVDKFLNKSQVPGGFNLVKIAVSLGVKI